MVTLGEGIQFTARQRQVTQLIAEGCSKLGAKNRVQAALMAEKKL